jgi:3-oxoacyl-[acyl-carrier-protein] synthase III
MPAVTIAGTGGYLPGEPLSNADLEALVGPLPPEVLEGIEVRERHWMIDPRTGEHLGSNSEMAAAAGRRALSCAGVDAGDVDLLVVSTASPDFPLPPMATLVQDHLGIRACTALELRSGSAGAVEALEIARAYVERGSHELALVIGSEAISPLLFPIFRGLDPRRIRMRDRMTLYTFGDGAGAIVLRAGEGPGILAAASASVGGGRKPGMQIVGAGTHAPVHEQTQSARPVELRVDYAAGSAYATHVIAAALTDLLGRSGLRARDIDACILPEGNAGHLAEEIAVGGADTTDWEGLADRVLDNLADVGATGSAALPLALDQASRTGKLDPGALVMLLAIESSKWKYAGMILPWTASVPADSATWHVGRQTA